MSTPNRQTLSPLHVALTLALLSPSFSHAQSATLRFANNSHPDIPLLSASDVVLLGNGNYEARCVLASGTTRCQGTSAGSATGPLPTASLSAASSATTGAAFSITRSTGNGAEVCVATSTPSAGVSGWSGAVGPGSGASTVTFSSTGTYSLSMRCYNAHGAATSNAVSVTVTQGGTGTPTNCSISDPQIRPAGMTAFDMTWNQVFERAYPGAPGYLIPLGSFTPQRSMEGPLSSSMYLTIAFVAQSRIASSIALYSAQPIAAVGYNQYRRGDAFISVSPCAGDFRPPNPSSPDVFLRACRVFGSSGTLSFGNVPSPSSSYCQLVPGQTYYVNVVLAPPGQVNGFTNACENGLSRCEVNSQPRFEQL